MSKSVLKTVYRAALRAAARCARVGERSVFDPAVPDGLDSAALRRQARSGGVAIDSLLKSTQLLNVRATALERDDYAPKPAEVSVSVGQVMRRRDTGARVAVVGYDSTDCSGDAPSSATQQPHYYVVEDVRDSWMARSQQGSDSAGTGAAPLSLKLEVTVDYIQQDLLEPLPGGLSAAERVVLHPWLPRYFTSYDSRLARFTPAPSLASLYPDDSWRLALEARGSDAATGTHIGASSEDVQHIASLLSQLDALTSTGLVEAGRRGRTRSGSGGHHDTGLSPDDIKKVAGSM